MLPSNKRLTRQQVTDFLKNSDIKVVFNRLGTFKYLGQSNSGTLGFTVVTGSKNQKKAVLRNKIRRQLYVLARQYGEIPFICMLYVSKQSYDMSYAELKTNLYALLEKSSKNN
jgi:ribonuclease P protein component